MNELKYLHGSNTPASAGNKQAYQDLIGHLAVSLTPWVFQEIPLFFIKKGCDGREVKALDSKSNGVSPRRFESCSQRKYCMEPICSHWNISKNKWKRMAFFIQTILYEYVGTRVLLGF